MVRDAPGHWFLRYIMDVRIGSSWRAIRIKAISGGIKAGGNARDEQDRPLLGISVPSS